MMSQLSTCLAIGCSTITARFNATKYAMFWVMLCLYPINSAFAILGLGGLHYVGPIPNAAVKHGYVMARSVVLDPETNEPILVSYNTDGTEAGVVSVGGNYQVNKLSIMAAAAFFAEQQRI